MPTKQCARCSKYKDFSAFAESPRTADGRSSCCLPCLESRRQNAVKMRKAMAIEADRSPAACADCGDPLPFTEWRHRQQALNGFVLCASCIADRDGEERALSLRGEIERRTAEVRAEKMRRRPSPRPRWTVPEVRTHLGR